VEIVNQKKQWQKIYEEWKSSGQTQREYCKTRGISFGIFKNQAHKLGLSARGSKFKAIEIGNPKEEISPYCEIKFEGGNQIVIESRESLVYLKQLIRSVVQS